MTAKIHLYLIGFLLGLQVAGQAVTGDPLLPRASYGRYLEWLYGERPMTTEPLLLRPGFQAVYFAAKDNGKREFIYGFCWYTRGVFHAEETGRGQMTQIGEQMMDLHSAGQLSTTLSVVPPLPGLPRLVQVHRTCFWHAWLELYAFEDGRFRKVWQVSPWMSEKGAFTRRNTFEFKDVNGDGVADIVNLCVTTQAWQPGAPEETVREVYGWNGKRFSLLAKRPATP